jgi:hypothetical protein
MAAMDCKKAYNTPTITVHGEVPRLTFGNNGSNIDASNATKNGGGNQP